MKEAVGQHVNRVLVISDKCVCACAPTQHKHSFNITLPAELNL